MARRQAGRAIPGSIHSKVVVMFIVRQNNDALSLFNS